MVRKYISVSKILCFFYFFSAAQDKTQKTLDFQKWTFKNYFMSKRTVFIHWWLQFCFQRGTFLEKFNKIFVNIFFGKSCNDYQNVQYVPASKEKNFETEISAHMGCAIGTPNFLDLVGINPATSSLNRIFVTFFLEKKSGWGENSCWLPSCQTKFWLWESVCALRVIFPFYKFSIFSGS